MSPNPILLIGMDLKESRKAAIAWVLANLSINPKHVSKANFLMDLDTYDWDPTNAKSFQELSAREVPTKSDEPSEKLLKFIENHVEECLHPEDMIGTILREQIRKKIGNSSGS